MCCANAMLVSGSYASGCDCGYWQHGVLVDAHNFILPCKFQWNRGSGQSPSWPERAQTDTTLVCVCLLMGTAG